jgi:hypothetical protein
MTDQSKTKAVKCVRDWRDFSADYYRLPTDGRKWRLQATNRMRLADYLSTFANGDGTRITVGVERVTEKLGVDRAMIFRWLDDLRELHALAPKSGLVSEHGCAVRALTLDRFVARSDAYMDAQATAAERAFERYQESQVRKAGVAGSQEQESQVHEQESQVRPEYATQPSLTVIPTKILTDQTNRE